MHADFYKPLENDQYLYTCFLDSCGSTEVHPRPDTCTQGSGHPAAFLPLGDSILSGGARSCKTLSVGWPADRKVLP